MRKVSEYQAHAAECRKMAAATSNQVHKQQLIDMVQAWDMLAAERRKQLAKRETAPELPAVRSSG